LPSQVYGTKTGCRPKREKKNYQAKKKKNSKKNKTNGKTVVNEKKHRQRPTSRIREKKGQKILKKKGKMRKEGRPLQPEKFLSKKKAGEKTQGGGFPRSEKGKIVPQREGKEERKGPKRLSRWCRKVKVKKSGMSLTVYQKKQGKRKTGA